MSRLDVFEKKALPISAMINFNITVFLFTQKELEKMK